MPDPGRRAYDRRPFARAAAGGRVGGDAGPGLAVRRPGLRGGIAALVSLPSVLAAQALAAVSGWLFRALGG
jgi:hypothetical protein